MASVKINYVPGDVGAGQASMPLTLLNFCATESGMRGYAIWVCWRVRPVFPFASVFLERGTVSLPPCAHGARYRVTYIVDGQIMSVE